MYDCCIISIGWLTSLIDSSVNLVMSLVSHGLLYIHLVHLILLLRSCVDLDAILVICLTNCCMTLPFSYMIACCLSMWGTHVSPYLQTSSLGRLCVSWFCVCSWRLVAPCFLLDRASD